MARTTTPAIPAKMYRHFAVVTLALTAAIAMFADGESQSSAVQLAGTRHPARARPAKPKLTGSPSPALGDDGTDNAFGTPSAGPGAGRSSDYTPYEGLLAAGYSRDYLDTLSAQDRQGLYAAVHRAGTVDPSHRAEAAALAAASAARSGARAVE